MTAQTGRTVSKWTAFFISDSADVLRQLPISSVSAVGITFDEQTGITAFQDAVNGSLPNMPNAPIDISGPWDTTAAAASTSLSGSHTVLSALVAAVAAGTYSPLSLDVQFGVRHAWESGEPQFGITASTTSGYYCSAYTFDPNAGTYSASFRLIPGSALPAFGTAAET